MKDPSCIFCKIIDKKIPAEIVDETPETISFLDINPVNAGHVLVIPKEHIENMPSSSDKTISDVFTTARKMMKKVKNATNADYVAISVVGLDVPHLHVHVIPRFNNDGMADFWPTKQYTGDEAKTVADKIRQANEN